MAEERPATNAHVDTAFRRVLDSIKQLPSPPEVCLRVTTVIQDEDDECGGDLEADAVSTKAPPDSDPSLADDEGVTSSAASDVLH